MLNVVKYMDSGALVVVYKDFEDMEVEERLKILENIAKAEDYAIAKVEPPEMDSEELIKVNLPNPINTFKEFREEINKPEEEQDKLAIKQYLVAAINKFQPEVFEKYTENQLEIFIETYIRFVPETVKNILDKYVENKVEKASNLLCILKENLE